MSDISLRLSVPDRQIQRARALANMKGRFQEVRATPEVSGRLDLWTKAVERIGSDCPLIILDFGVFEGKSTRFWAEHFSSSKTVLHGFDSFTGLPEDWSGKMIKGTFSTGGATPEINDPRVNFHVGWIQNTLPPFIKSLDISRDRKILVHIDIDLYSAALFILTTLWHYVDEYYVMFDEFGVDENLALSDYLSAYPADVDFFGHTFGQKFNLPQQVFGHIRRIPYQV